MFRTTVLAGVMLALLTAPGVAGKLDNLNSGLSDAPDPQRPAETTTRDDYLASLLPLTDAVMAEKFPSEHAELVEIVGDTAGLSDTERQTALVSNLTRIAINFELRLLDAPDAANTVIVDRQNDYISAVLEGEGADVCAPVIYNGSSELIGRGLYAKYAAEIDATMAAYWEAVKQAIDNPVPVGEMSEEDSLTVIDQMTAQGDKALMDHFSVMEVDSPENCPAVLAIIKAANVIAGDAGIRLRAAQARGASRL